MSQNNSITFISIENLVFDKDNPRLPKSISRSENAILDWMLNKESILELMSSIGEKGFFAGEPILVVKDEDTSKYIVIEGNRRYTSSLLLIHPDKAPNRKISVQEISDSANERPTELPALIFDSREDILDYLGYRHITGVEAWDALAKARYLSQLNDRLESDSSQKEKYNILAKQIGSTSTYVRQLLLGKQLYDVVERNNFFDIPNLNDQSFEFGTFYTGIVKNNIASYVGVDIDSDTPLDNINNEHIGDLTKWMFEKNSENQTRLGESRNLTKLNKILDPKYESALIAFKEHGLPLSVAVDLTDEADEIVTKKINEAYNAINIAWNYLPKIKDYRAINKEQLVELSRTIKLVHENLKERERTDSEIDVL